MTKGLSYTRRLSLAPLSHAPRSNFAWPTPPPSLRKHKYLTHISLAQQTSFLVDVPTLPYNRKSFVRCRLSALRTLGSKWWEDDEGFGLYPDPSPYSTFIFPKETQTKPRQRQSSTFLVCPPTNRSLGRILVFPQV